MPNVLVRDVPDDVHAALQRRAERRGQSLQQYLSSELRRLAERPSVDEVLDRIERRRGGQVGLRQAAEDLGEERFRRWSSSMRLSWPKSSALNGTTGSETPSSSATPGTPPRPICRAP